MLDVLDDSGFEIEFLTPSTWMTRMRAGQLVRIHIDELRRPYAARLLRISPRIDPVSQSIKVTASMEGSVKDLRAGMSGRIQLP
jgi:multidrug efflux pump subunit AcrA (membrane-fusion protein)